MSSLEYCQRICGLPSTEMERDKTISLQIWPGLKSEVSEIFILPRYATLNYINMGANPFDLYLVGQKAGSDAVVRSGPVHVPVGSNTFRSAQLPPVDTDVYAYVEIECLSGDCRGSIFLSPY